MTALHRRLATIAVAIMLWTCFPARTVVCANQWRRQRWFHPFALARDRFEYLVMEMQYRSGWLCKSSIWALSRVGAGSDDHG
jgi:hypothetical protein